MIEKNIITAIPNKEKIPDEVKESINQMMEKNQDWTFYIFSNDDIETFMKTRFKKYYKYFDMIREEYYVAKVDLFRILWIYSYGGIWIDAKIHWTGSLDDFISNKSAAITMQDIPFKTFAMLNGFFAFRKKHPILKKIIKETIRRISQYEKWYKQGIFNGHSSRKQILNITGPGIFRDVLKKEKLQNFNQTPIDSDRIIWTVFEPEIDYVWNSKKIQVVRI